MAAEIKTPIEWLTQFYTKWDLEDNNKELPTKEKLLKPAEKYYKDNNLDSRWYNEVKKNAGRFNQNFLKNKGRERAKKEPYPPKIAESAPAPAPAPAPATIGFTPAPAPMGFTPAPSAAAIVDKVTEQLSSTMVEMDLDVTEAELNTIIIKTMKVMTVPPSVGGWDPPNTDKGNQIRQLLIEQVSQRAMGAVMDDTGGATGGGRSARRRGRKNKANTKKKVRKSSKRRSRKRKSSKRRRRKRKYRTRR